MAHSMNHSLPSLSATTKIILFALKNGVTATTKQGTANTNFKCAQ